MRDAVAAGKNTHLKGGTFLVKKENTAARLQGETPAAASELVIGEVIGNPDTIIGAAWGQQRPVSWGEQHTGAGVLWMIHLTQYCPRRRCL